MKEIINNMVLELDKNFLMHDFRMVKGPTKTNLIFEIAIPFDSKISEHEIVNLLTTKIKNIDKKYKPVIMVEKQMYI